MCRTTPVGLTFALCAAIAACGGKKDAPNAKDDAASGPTVAPLSMPVSGVDKIARMNFVYGDGWPSYEKAVAARAKKDAATAKSLAEAAIAKDPYHLDAHRMLAGLLAAEGEHAAVVDHLVTALGDDYFRYGPTLATDDDLKEFRATPHGQSVLVLAQKIHDDYAKRIAGGVWLVGRRSTFKWPAPGPQWATTRGELYAYDRDTRRYLRLTHTDHKVAGFVRAPGGTEVAVLGFDKIDRPKADTDPATLVTAWVLVLDTTEWRPLGPRAVLPAAREIQLGYGAGDQLLVGTAAATGRWTAGPPAVAAIDKTTGKLAPVATPLPVPRIAFTLDEGRVVRAADGVEAAWSGEPPATTSLKAGGPAIPIPESGQAAQASVAVAPGGARLAFATAVDPCAKDLAPSLYVADTKTAALKHLLTAKSRFTNRWIDATTLAYEDGEGAIRLWDATTQREIGKLDNRVGIALDVLSLAPAALCIAAPPVVDVGGGAGAGSADEPLPPEEGSGSGAGSGGSAGPVTAPQ